MTTSPTPQPAKKAQYNDDDMGLTDESSSSGVGDDGSFIIDEADNINIKLLSTEQCKDLLNETYHKRNKIKLLAIIKKYSKIPSQLIPDLKAYKVIVQTRSSRPLNMTQRIDRLIDFINTM